MKDLWFAAALAVALGVPLGASAGSDRADVALVLAIDVSGSVDDNRFKLQREGIAAALESEELAAAVSGGVNQTIEVAVVEWAEEQRLLVPWTVLRGRDDLEALATRLRTASRSWVHTMTDPGGGIAAALESEEVAAAVSSGVNQTIEVSVVEWAEEQRLLVPWTVLRGRDDLDALAARLRSASRSWVHTMTDPGGGIAAAERLFADQPLIGLRHVIDVSGDGRQNTGEVATTDARDAAVSHGLTVNGLPIASGDEPEIADWYLANVVGGPGAFLVVADSYDAFAAAFRQKLMLEITGLAPGRKLAHASSSVQPDR